MGAAMGQLTSQQQTCESQKQIKQYPNTPRNAFGSSILHGLLNFLLISLSLILSVVYANLLCPVDFIDMPA